VEGFLHLLLQRDQKTCISAYAYPDNPRGPPVGENAGGGQAEPKTRKKCSDLLQGPFYVGQ
jgi:hypothetical protein